MFGMMGYGGYGMMDGIGPLLGWIFGLIWIVNSVLVGWALWTYIKKNSK